MTDSAMHIPNGVINGPTSAAFAVVAAALLVACVHRARTELDDRLVPLAGLTAAFIFAVQMLNFPVLPGVSGHLLGGALAVALVGPWIGALCVSIVLIVQALLFADGGVTALGLSIVNMALIATFLAYGLMALLLRVLPRTAAGVTAAVFVTSVVSVVAGSAGFVLQYWVGGTADLGTGMAGIAGSMLGVHTLIGVGEGVITATTVLTVAKARPDLVYALRGTEINLTPATNRSAA